ncbi:hypothetical protein HYFRA_00001287 [Hymenoscyphus fraxineus]|uniref:N-acetyltransferase domain-containing protein n=1 Tax=Hymenoscyphus fraxineus TaxID=746836 RepID=A0A9N9PMA0_9HELO|nr:hypothetical protein HYFRA_00001287 [Hymenoscyphus fraxineus]
MSLPKFYIHPQDSALKHFPPLLSHHLPLSNAIHNRLRAPQNTPLRHCLFAATFSPDTSNSTPSEPWTILFSDRSRLKESQIWIFNSLITSPVPLSPQESKTLRLQVREAVHFLKNTEVTEAPGWPFDPLLRFGGVHSLITEALVAEFPDAISYITRWNMYTIPTTSSPSASGKRPLHSQEKKTNTLPPSFTLARVPTSHLPLIISTSSIPRQAETLQQQANACILNPEGEPVAWVYLGLDGSLATLYVVPAYRGKGLATIVARDLLKRLEEGGFEDLGIRGSSGWVHAEAKEGNVESEAVMRRLGGCVKAETAYLCLDCGKI